MNIEFVQNWFSQVKKGTLSYIILIILDEKEYYGYELVQEIKIHTTLEVAEGTLYPLLNRLKTDGIVESKWIEQESGIPRKYYTLTTEGRETLQEMKKIWSTLETAINKLQK
ncbi:PadR family transcriptional regulator PadR [Mucilaginibacter frigoritolerans]|uniref:PadR family transcriptional regulator PadR n=1 Tax=Mucilaginibacter frigoritolerans TaxID=652788 RepID=A0A562U7V6_9SPHI|nr:PadR family transcriptional regulator [Mucilaginibacter frigoritolerans]TWJ01435.1 PadR family transcriptional regulator PadR [Mucilaginibacter frigoritolerans]